jgi:hypothetical protein
MKKDKEVKKMKNGDGFYNQLADKLSGAMHSGNHSHYCEKCQAHKYCPQITHCRLADKAICFDCLAKIASAKGQER